MNVDEARRELERFNHRRFRLYFGIIVGIVGTLIVLGLSFIRPHIIFILDMWIVYGVAFGIYCFYMINKLRKIDEVLQNSGRKIQ